MNKELRGEERAKMKKKVATLAELKGEKVRLRDELEGGDEKMRTLVDYLKVSRRVKELESYLLWGLVIAVLFIGGCQTFKGAAGDSAWMLQKLSDNVQTEK